MCSDPRIALGMNEQRAGYGWARQDETDFNGTISNTGVITLNGVNQFLDLGIASGPHSVGTTLPIIGGPSFSGITFEVLFKAKKHPHTLTASHVQVCLQAANVTCCSSCFYSF